MTTDQTNNSGVTQTRVRLPRRPQNQPSTRPESVEELEEQPNDVDTDNDETIDDGSEAIDSRSDTGVQALMSTLLSDPQIQQVLNARREGREISITDVESTRREQQTQTTQQVDEEFESALEEIGDEDLKKLTKLFIGRLNASLEPITERVAGLESIAETVQKQSAQTQIRDMAKQFRDFPKYQQQMVRLARENPRLSIKQLYVLAKADAGQLELAPASTHSERPTTPPRRRTTRSDTGERRRSGPGRAEGPKLHGRRAFQMSLADALEDLDLSGME